MSSTVERDVESRLKRGRRGDGVVEFIVDYSDDDDGDTAVGF